MTMSRLNFVVLFLVCSPMLSVASPRHMRGSAGLDLFPWSSVDATEPSTVSSADIKSRLAAIEQVLILGDGSGVEVQQLERIEQRIVAMYNASPKNERGRLAPPAVRSLVHRYFTKEHGSVISGLEHHGHNPSFSVFEHVNVLKDKAPSLLESLLETRQSGYGLALIDAVVMIAVLERLIEDESLDILKNAYRLNRFVITEELNETSLDAVLVSYIISMHNKLHRDFEPDRHENFKALVSVRKADAFNQMQSLASSAAANLRYSRRDLLNPFQAQQFSFREASQAMHILQHSFSDTLSYECLEMKEHLVSMDKQGTGRVPLSAFYGSTTVPFKFLESMDYLRESGSLDESIPGAAQLIVVNYMIGTSNCIDPSLYYSYCCKNECEDIMHEIEAAVQAPSASPEQLLWIFGNLSLTPREAPGLKELSAKRLYSIAGRHGGTVPLHSRLFAQWLHYAFPFECPYPHIVKDAAVLSVQHGLKSEHLLPPSTANEAASSALEAEAESELGAHELPWSDEEVLVLAGPTPSLHDCAKSLARLIASTLAVFSLLSSFGPTLSLATKALFQNSAKKTSLLPKCL